MTKLKPKVSFIITARNDNYGGNMLSRMNTMVRVLRYLAEKNKVPIELIIVEYNPPKDKPRLNQEAKELELSSNEFLTMRLIEVPAEFHDKIKTNKIPLYEYIAKNIGVRRAEGEFVVCTNPDIIFSEEAFAYIVNKANNKNTIYRINRADTSMSVFDSEMQPQEVIAVAKNTAYRILDEKGGRILNILSEKGLRSWVLSFVYQLYSLWFYFKNKKIIPNKYGYKDIMRPTKVHESASGDFLMLHKDIWNRVGGYDQAQISGYIDGFLMYTLFAYGYKQEIITAPIYHMEHLMTRFGRPRIDLIEYRLRCLKMLEEGKPEKPVNQDWGYPLESFEEIRI